jgi:hypothetical protein
MKIEWMPILVIGAPTVILFATIIWVDFVVPRLIRRRRMLRRLGLERGGSEGQGLALPVDKSARQT